jgi:hypothetical protein
MSREAKFNFEEEKKLSDISSLIKQHSHTATVNGKHGYIRFSLEYVRDANLDNSYIKFYADKSKKAIAWKVLHEKNLKLCGYRHVAIYTTKTGKYVTKHCQITISKLLQLIGAKEQSYQHLAIQKYKPGPLDDELHYVELQ